MKPWIFDTLSDDIFTDRKDWFDYLYKLGKDTKDQKTIMSVAVIGLRRLGKTELFRRVYNSLFFDQNDVVPIFWTYEGKNLINPHFSKDYLKNFLRQYIAFKNKEKYPEILEYDLDQLLEHTLKNGTDGMQHVMRRFINQMRANDENEMLTIALNAPKLFAAYNEEPIIVYIDEFQEILKVRNSDGTDPDCIGNYQEAVENLRCPHVVTGSAMTLILRDILGTGPLFGRFAFEYIKGMDEYFAKDLVYKWCKSLHVPVTEEMAVILARRCGGNPFYIRAIVRQAHQLGMDLKDIPNLDRVIATDLVQGAIWDELERQVRRFIVEQNKQGIGFQILHYASKYEKIDFRDIEKIAKEIGCTYQETSDMLSDLARADLLEEAGFRGSFYHQVSDPILNEFLKVWSEVRVENIRKERAGLKKLDEYRKKAKQFDNYRGITVQIYTLYMMTKWDNREIENGKEFFGIDQPVTLPKFMWVDSETVKHPTTGEAQIDIVGINEFEQWFGECKYWTGHAVDMGVVKAFVEGRAEIARKVYERENTVLWFISKRGFTKPAIAYMVERGILHSTEEQLDRLLETFGVKRLPKTSET